MQNATVNESSLVKIAGDTPLTIYGPIFVMSVPYTIVLVFFFISRKTDNRQPQYSLLLHMVVGGIVVFSMMFIFSTFSMLLANSQHFFVRNKRLLGTYNCILLFVAFANCIFPITYSTAFSYLLLLSALQRLALVTNFRFGMQILTGRRLRGLIWVCWLVALGSSLEEFSSKSTALWGECVVFAIACWVLLAVVIKVRHLEHKLLASAHVTVMMQMLPLFFFQSMSIGWTLFTYFKNWHNSFSNDVQRRLIHAFVMALASPIALTLGSWTKRRILWAVVTCQWDEQHGRGEVYTSETPATCNAVSLSSTPTRF